MRTVCYLALFMTQLACANASTVDNCMLGLMSRKYARATKPCETASSFRGPEYGAAERLAFGAAHALCELELKDENGVVAALEALAEEYQDEFGDGSTPAVPEAADAEVAILAYISRAAAASREPSVHAISGVIHEEFGEYKDANLHWNRCYAASEGKLQEPCALLAIRNLTHTLRRYRDAAAFGAPIARQSTSKLAPSLRRAVAAAYSELGQCDEARAILRSGDTAAATRSRSSLELCAIAQPSISQTALFLPLRVQESQEREASAAFEVVLSVVDERAMLRASTLRDVEALLAREEAADALGCDSTSCAAEIGGALGVDLVVHGNYSILGDQRVLGLHAVQVSNSRSLARVTARWVGVSSAAKEIEGAVDELSARVLRKLRDQSN